MENIPSYRLEGIIHEKNSTEDFEGPLSLILVLLQKNKIEIRDIQISRILEQYLSFLEGMEKLNLEIASEFVQMASYLLLIKSRMLLAKDEEQSELELLVESLEQLKAKDALTALKEVSPSILEAYKTGCRIYSKPPSPPPDSGEYKLRHEPYELLQALRNVFLGSAEKPYDSSAIEKAMPRKITYSVKTKSRAIISRLKLRDMKLSELYSECSSASEIVATFVSVLELCSQGTLKISVTRDGSGYELSFAGGDIDHIIEKIDREYE